MSDFACFVTGTDTEVGKTLISCALLHALTQVSQRACAMKPVAAGAVFVPAGTPAPLYPMALAAESAAHFTEFNLPLPQGTDFASAVTASNARHAHLQDVLQQQARARLAQQQALGMTADQPGSHGNHPAPHGSSALSGPAGSWHNEDVDLLQAHSQLKLPAEQIAPYLFRAASAPHIAAMREQRSIERHVILSAYHQLRAQSDALVVEGVGGFRVPLADDFDTADLAQELGLPVILVVGIRLGCLNHALLTAEAIAARGLTLAGWVANLVDDSMPYAFDNSTALAERLSAPLLGCVPRLSTASAAAAAACLDFSLLPNWPGNVHPDRATPGRATLGRTTLGQAAQGQDERGNPPLFF